MKLRALLLIVLLALLVPRAASAAPGEITRYPLPAGTAPEGIAAGADGNLWFAEHGANAIGRITPGGQVTEFPLPTADARPMQVAPGADGSIWFTEWRSGNVGRIAPDGALAEFPICDEYCHPWGLTGGPDGNMWVVLQGSGEVARVTPEGAVTKFSLGVSLPAMIAAGPDGNLWLADSALVDEEPGPGEIIRLTPAGERGSFPVPSPVENFRPLAIAAGDGALWFAGGGRNLGRIATDGTITELPLRVSGEADSMVVGREGDIWVAKNGPAAGDGSIDRVTPNGHLTSYYVPYGSRGVTVGPEGDIWFTEGTEGAIGRIAPGAAGLEIGAERSPVHGKWARLPISCGGGASGSRCVGTVVLRVGLLVHRPGKIPQPHKIRVGAAHYSVADGRTAVVHVRLNLKRLKRFRRKDEVRTVAVARASAGVGERHRFLLTLP